MVAWEGIKDSLSVPSSFFQASVSPPPPSPNQSYQGSSGYNFRPTDARCLPRSVLLHAPADVPLEPFHQLYFLWIFSPEFFSLLPLATHCLSQRLVEPVSGPQCPGDGVPWGQCLSSAPLLSPTPAVPSGCSLPSTPLPAPQGPLGMVNPQTGEILPLYL